MVKKIYTHDKVLMKLFQKFPGLDRVQGLKLAMKLFQKFPGLDRVQGLRLVHTKLPTPIPLSHKKESVTMAQYNNWITKGVPYVLTVILAAAFIFFGNRFATMGMFVHDYAYAGETFEVRVTEVLSVTEHSAGDEYWHVYLFAARITTRGASRGDIVNFTQSTRFLQETAARIAREGDRVMLVRTAAGAWSFIDFVRFGNVAALGIIFFGLLIAFCRFKGFNTMVSLGFTGLAVFSVFIPSVLSGRNIYVMAIMICVFTIVTTLFMTNGINKKTAAAVLGCLGGIFAAGVITLITSSVMELTGVTQPESRILLTLIPDNPIDLNALIFAGIIIGASGAIMDTAVSISAALWEIKRQAPDISFAKLYRSGINIGKDIMGTSINTLVLAYIGGSLTIVIFFLSHFNSVTRILNRELVLVEFMQAIIGGFGILLAMPLTAVVCAFLLKGDRV